MHTLVAFTKETQRTLLYRVTSDCSPPLSEQMTYHLAGIETELEIATQAIDGVRYAVTEGLEGIRYAVHEGSTVVYKSLEEIQQMRGDIERLGQVLIDAREDCAQYFEEFSSKLDDVQMRVEKLQVIIMVLQYIYGTSPARKYKEIVYQDPYLHICNKNIVNTSIVCFCSTGCPIEARPGSLT